MGDNHLPFLPETAGRSLKEIDHIFASSIIWDSVKIAKSLPKRRLVEALEEDSQTKAKALHPKVPKNQARRLQLENGEKVAHANGRHNRDPLGVHV